MEKDAICAMALIKPSSDDTAVGNVVLFTELKFMHILDNYGHSITKSLSIDVVAHEVFAFGSYPANYSIVCVGRSSTVLIIENVPANKLRVIKGRSISRRRLSAVSSITLSYTYSPIIRL